MQQYLIPRNVARTFAAILLALAIVNLTGMVHIERVTGSIPAFCPFKVITGIDCPGCGMTRAMTSLIDGRPGDAALYNPFCFFLLFMLLISVIPERWMLRTRVHTRFLPVLYSVVLALVMIFWVFDRLLPHIN